MERRRYKRVKRFLRYCALRAVHFLLGLVPLRAALAVGRVAGTLFFWVAKGERERARRSLALALPEESPERREQLARACFRFFGAMACELCKLRQIDRNIKEWVELPPEAIEVLRKAREEGRGTIFVSGHLGNFELLARRVAAEGFASQSIAKETSDPRTTAFIERMRASGGVKTLWRGHDGTGRAMLRALRANEILGLVIDVDTKVQGFFVDFFGRKAFTPRAAADLAIKFKAAVVEGFAEPREGGGHALRLLRVPLPPEGMEHETAALELTQRLTSGIEEAIRRHPERWTWMHDRWKTRPPSEVDAERSPAGSNSKPAGLPTFDKQ